MKAPPRRRFGRSTIVLTAILCIPWILVAVPGLRQEANSKQNAAWRGEETMLTFGWPFVHAARLEVDPVVYDKMRKVVGTDEAGATPERLDACLQSLKWSDLLYLVDVAEVPQVMTARPILGHRLADDSDEAFWSESENWWYWKQGSVTKWYGDELLYNLLLFSLYVVVLAIVLEFFRRKRRKWYQVSLLDFVTLSAVVGVSTALIISESNYGKRQKELTRELLAVEGMSASSNLEAPVFLSRLLDGANGWKRFVPEGSFWRLTGLYVDTWKTNSESEFAEFQHRLESSPLDYVKHFDLSLRKEDHDVLINAIGTKQLCSLRLDLRPSGYGFGPSGGASKFQTLVKFERFPQLESLRLQGHLHYFDLPDLPNLKDLEFDWIGGGSGEVKAWINAQKKLDRVMVSGVGLESAIEALPDSVRTVYLTSNDEELDLSGLARLTNLEKLVGFTMKTAVSSAPELPKLRRLTLVGFRVVEPVPKRWLELQPGIWRIAE